jgi:anaerobic ribonucleoside-triphosphate reductase activating protein
MKPTILIARGPMYNVPALGFGTRTVIWTQGCDLACAGCMSKDTWDRDGGQAVDIETLVDRIVERSHLDAGLTISGGEPMIQPSALGALVEGIRRRSIPAQYDIVVYTGFRRSNLGGEALKLLDRIDVLVDGPFVQGRPGDGMRGSSNQTVHLLTELATARYGSSDRAGLVARITTDGVGTLVGVAPRVVDRLRDLAKASGLEVDASW